MNLRQNPVQIEILSNGPQGYLAYKGEIYAQNAIHEPHLRMLFQSNINPITEYKSIAARTFLNQAYMNSVRPTQQPTLILIPLHTERARSKNISSSPFEHFERH